MIILLLVAVVVVVAAVVAIVEARSLWLFLAMLVMLLLGYLAAH